MTVLVVIVRLIYHSNVAFLKSSHMQCFRLKHTHTYYTAMLFFPCSFHILTAMFTGFANTVNSLYNIKQMVYSDNDVTTLDNFKMALITNWGHK